jgi:DNA-binding MarR family transcriptional regulator
MATSPLGFTARENAGYTITLDPPRSALISLAMLSADPQAIDVEDWVHATAAALTAEQRRRNRLVFEGFGAALLPTQAHPDLRTYLSALETMPAVQLRDQLLHGLAQDSAQAADARLLLSDMQAYNALLNRLSPGQPLDPELAQEAHRLLNDPPALQDLIVAHLYDMSESVLGAEWERQLARMAGFPPFLEQRPLPAGTAADTIRAFINRELPDAISAQLAGVRQVHFVLSPHIRLHAARFGSATAIWVFVLGHFKALPLRAAPIKRGELLRPLTALADETRLHILELLAHHDELPTQEIIAQLDQSQPNVSRHLKQLIAAGFVEELRGDGAHKRYRLNAQPITAAFWTLRQLLSPENARPTEADARAGQPEQLRRFLDATGRVTMWPAKRPSQELLLSYLISKLEQGREYTEREINELLNQWHTYKDHATLRRALYDAQLLDRTPDGARYWRAPEVI